MATAPIRMNVNAAPVEPADQQRLLAVRPDGELVQVEVDLGVGGVPQGASGQLVGYDAQGKPIPVTAPTSGAGYDDAQIKQELLAVQQALSNAASADDLTAAVEQLADLAETVSTLAVAGYDDTQIKADLADAAERLTAAEQALSDLPEPVDLTAVQNQIAQLTARIDGLDGGVVNRPPTASTIPAQALTLGTAFAANFSGYFDDPDGHALSAMDVTGTLPPGITQDGFAFTGTPTTTGNYSVTLTVADLYGEQVSRTIAWTVAAVATATRSVQPAPGGYSLQNAGFLNQVTPVPAIGGYTLEIV